MLLNKRASECKHSKSFCVALGGVITALVLLIMFCSTLFPMLDYALPTYAGFLMVIVMAEAGTGWAFMTYAACAVLCMLMTPDYQANLLFILFMGYYPILYVHLFKIKKKPLRVFVKLIVFNTAIIVFGLIYTYLFAGTDLFEGMEKFGMYAVPLMIFMANVFFGIYEVLLGRLIELYTRWFRIKILTRK